MFNNFLNNFKRNPLYDNKHYYLANHLLNESVLLTFRYQKNNSLGFRLFDNLDITDLTLKNEDRDNKKYNLFDYLKTYRNFGGYAMPFYFISLLYFLILILIILTLNVEVDQILIF